jgi:hypothetical protein
MADLNQGASIEAALLPCPMCGSADVKFSSPGGDDEASYDFVICNECGLSAARADCDGDPRETWNRRAPPIAAAAEELPPLPEPDHSLDCGMQPFYRPDQLLKFGRDAIALYQRKQAGKTESADDSSRVSALRAEPAGQHSSECLPARRFVNIEGFWDADYVDFAEGCENGGGVLDGVSHPKHYTRSEAESYVAEGAWREVAVPRRIEQSEASRSRAEGGHGEPDATKSAQEGDQPMNNKGDSNGQI